MPSKPTSHRALTRAALAGIGASALLVTGVPVANAHVTVTPSTTAAGSYAVLTFSVGHGCDSSPTTEVVVQMPEQIVTVTPTVNTGWKVAKRMETLAEPVDDGHGGTYTERVAQVVYTAKTPLPDGFRDTFELSLQLPDDEGGTLVFPVLQACAEGQNAWVQTYEDGQEEPELPAPFIELTAAEGSAHDHAAEESEDGHAASAAEAAEVSEAGIGGSSAVGWLGLALGAAGVAAGGTALARSRR